MTLIHGVHAVLLTGGSAYGLDAASGVMRWLEERGIGPDVGVGVVPIVPAAVLLDLRIGDPKARPDADAGYEACQSATGGQVVDGSVGAGTAATVGKLMGIGCSTRSGLGTASTKTGRGIVVGPLVVVNAFGDVVDPASGRILAGAHRPGDGEFLDTAKQMHGRPRTDGPGIWQYHARSRRH
jgi:L-aminopeptidase/D-esterase-like protein